MRKEIFASSLLLVALFVFGSPDKARADESYTETMFLAIENGHTDLVEFLLSEGRVDVNSSREKYSRLGGNSPRSQRDSGPETLLGFALYLENYEISQLLIDKGANVNLPTYSVSPLAVAAFRGHPNTVKSLVGAGADISEQAGGRFPVMYSLVWGYPYREADRDRHLEVARFLIAEGVDVDKAYEYQKSDGSETPIVMAARLGFIDLVQILSSVSKTHIDEALFKPLGYYASVNSRNVPVVQFLIESGANVNRPFTRGRTALSALLGSKFEGPIRAKSFNDSTQEILLLLLEAGADVNVQDEDGFTPLMGVENLWALKTLVDAGANVNTQTAQGRTALMEAAIKGNLEVVEFLVNEAGANKNLVDSSGNTARDLAEVSYREAERGSNLRVRLQTISRFLRR